MPGTARGHRGRDKTLQGTRGCGVARDSPTANAATRENREVDARHASRTRVRQDDLGGDEMFFHMTSETSQSGPRPVPHGQPDQTEGRKNRLVLVVDDFEDNRSMYAAYLTYSGYDVLEAADGREAVEVASLKLPDVIVMDLSLPVMDGWEATRRLKADERTRHIPIIVLTGHAVAGQARDARKAGCDAFLAKPCLPEMLVEKVQELLQRQ